MLALGGGPSLPPPYTLPSQLHAQLSIRAGDVSAGNWGPQGLCGSQILLMGVESLGVANRDPLPAWCCFLSTRGACQLAPHTLGGPPETPICTHPARPPCHQLRGLQLGQAPGSVEARSFPPGSEPTNEPSQGCSRALPSTRELQEGRGSMPQAVAPWSVTSPRVGAALSQGLLGLNPSCGGLGASCPGTVASAAPWVFPLNAPARGPSGEGGGCRAELGAAGPYQLP